MRASVATVDKWKQSLRGRRVEASSNIGKVSGHKRAEGQEVEIAGKEPLLSLLVEVLGGLTNVSFSVHFYPSNQRCIDALESRIESL